MHLCHIFFSLLNHLRLPFPALIQDNFSTFFYRENRSNEKRMSTCIYLHIYQIYLNLCFCLSVPVDMLLRSFIGQKYPLVIFMSSLLYHYFKNCSLFLSLHLYVFLLLNHFINIHLGFPISPSQNISSYSEHLPSNKLKFLTLLAYSLFFGNSSVMIHFS